MSAELHVVTGDALTPAELYGIWMIRDLVFSLEQNCRLPDVDGIDLDAGVSHLWFADDGGPTSYMRSYLADGVRRVGRVCTRKEHRGRGLSGALMNEAIDRWGHEDLRIGAQSYLETWYGSFGFVTDGPHYDDAGIDHVPMLRTGR